MSQVSDAQRMREAILGRKSGSLVKFPEKQAINWSARRIFPDPANGGSVAAALAGEQVTESRIHAS